MDVKKANVREILTSTQTAVELAKKFKVTKSAIYGVIKRRTWRHISEEYVPPYKPKKSNSHSKKVVMEDCHG